jgi:hypothetical protein
MIRTTADKAIRNRRGTDFALTALSRPKCDVQN